MTNTTLTNTIVALENRIHVLTMRNPLANKRIINKLKRRLRNLQN